MAGFSEAKAAGARFYEGKACLRGHTRRYASTSTCAVCRPARPAPRLTDKPEGSTAARVSLASMWRRNCPACGPESLFCGSKCVNCGHDTNAKQERRLYRHPPRGLIAPIADNEANLLALMKAKA